MVKKNVYLTIDDAPSKDFREKIDFLISKNIPAIIFCVGNKIEDRSEDVIYAIKNKQASILIPKFNRSGILHDN